MHTRHSRSKQSIALLSSVLQPLVDNGLLSAKEVGRIAQTSQELHQACLGDSIWASFCQREYPVTRHIPKVIKEQKGHYLLYKSWSAPTVKRRPPATTLGPPSCLPIHIHLCLHMKYNGTPVASGIYNVGKSLMPLLQENGVRVNLRKPFVLGKAVWDYTDAEKTRYQKGDRFQGFGLRVKCKDLDPTNLDVRFHLYRSSDVGMCCLFSSSDTTRNGTGCVFLHPENSDNITPQSKFDLNRPQRCTHVSFRRGAGDHVPSWPLQHSPQAELILNAYPHPAFLEVHFEVGIINEDDFAITKLMILAMTKDREGRPPRRFTNDASHGVTLLHILSELQVTT